MINSFFFFLPDVEQGQKFDSMWLFVEPIQTDMCFYQITLLINSLTNIKYNNYLTLSENTGFYISSSSENKSNNNTYNKIIIFYITLKKSTSFFVVEALKLIAHTCIKNTTLPCL